MLCLLNIHKSYPLGPFTQVRNVSFDGLGRAHLDVAKKCYRCDGWYDSQRICLGNGDIELIKKHGGKRD